MKLHVNYITCMSKSRSVTSVLSILSKTTFDRDLLQQFKASKHVFVSH